MVCDVMLCDLNKCVPKWTELFQAKFLQKPRNARNFVKIHLHQFCTILYVIPKRHDHEALSTYLSTNEERYLSATRLILFWRWLNLTSKNCACRSNSVCLSVVLGLLETTSRNTENTLSPTADIHCQIPKNITKIKIKERQCVSTKLIASQHNSVKKNWINKILWLHNTNQYKYI